MGDDPPATYGCCGLNEQDVALALVALTGPVPDGDRPSGDDES